MWRIVTEYRIRELRSTKVIDIQLLQGSIMRWRSETEKSLQYVKLRKVTVKIIEKMVLRAMSMMISKWRVVIDDERLDVAITAQVTYITKSDCLSLSTVFPRCVTK